MNKYSYFYYHQSNINIQGKELYEGERISSKVEEVKFEDKYWIYNKVFNTKAYFTNFRILIMTERIAYDIPLYYIKTHYVKVFIN